MSLRQKILVSSALIVVPLAVLGIGAYLIARASLIDEANQQARIEAEFRAAEISRRLDIAQDELQSVAEWSGLTLPAVEGRLAQDADVFAEPLVAVSTWWEHFDGIAIVDRNGTVVEGPSRWAQGEPAPRVGAGAGPWSAVLSSDSIQLTQRLADSDLFVQALVPADFVFAGPIPEAEAIGRGSITATAEISELGIVVAASRSESLVVGALRPLLWLVVATVAVALIVAMATAWWLARHVLRRLAVLTRTTDAMNEGDWTARTGDLGSDELGRLG
ncbi:MAG: HAMP domain-containing protein, partial [Actinobacteria bacterium]|nr:HAMP domain-containing protein [Actinomycetota bacterium]